MYKYLLVFLMCFVPYMVMADTVVFDPGIDLSMEYVVDLAIDTPEIADTEMLTLPTTEATADSVVIKPRVIFNCDNDSCKPAMVTEDEGSGGGSPLYST